MSGLRRPWHAANVTLRGLARHVEQGQRAGRLGSLRTGRSREKCGKAAEDRGAAALADPRRAFACVVIAVFALSACSDDTSPAAGSETSADADPTTTTSTTAPADDGGADPSDDGTDGELGEVADPVALDAATDFGNGVGVRLAAIDSVTVDGPSPG